MEINLFNKIVPPPSKKKLNKIKEKKNKRKEKKEKPFFEGVRGNGILFRICPRQLNILQQLRCKMLKYEFVLERVGVGKNYHKNL